MGILSKAYLNVNSRDLGLLIGYASVSY